MVVDIVLLVLWIGIGMINLCGDRVSKSSYFLCWLVVISSIITRMIK